MKVAPKYVSAISANSCIKVLKLNFHKILKYEMLRKVKNALRHIEIYN